MANILYDELASVVGGVEPKARDRKPVRLAVAYKVVRAALARADRAVAAYLAELAAARSRGSRFARA